MRGLSELYFDYLYSATNNKTMQSVAGRTPERIVLRVDPTKKAAFLEMLKLFDFVEIENLQDQEKQYVKGAKKNVPFTYDDPMQETITVRKQRKAGSLAGRGSLPANFNEPIDDLSDYM